MKSALLLNSDWTPLRFVPERRALGLLFRDRAEIVSVDGNSSSTWEDEIISTISATFRIPATIRLKKYVERKWKPPRFRKKVLFNRDDWKCQYCGLQLQEETVTIDHVLPTSRGGKTSWHNCVTACKQCNKKKANRTPEEAEMRLKVAPMVPTTVHFWNAYRVSEWHEDWSHLL